ncbi:MAG TPA: glycosyltransferase family 1 protein [Candidatus Saccharimonadales bacterium]|nr:glycosyltransferase family 1 protein [Candidatus Saccharimonadales bacterium]
MTPQPKHIVIDARIRRSSTGRYTDRLVEHLQDIDTHNRYTILVQSDDPWRMHNPNFTTVVAPYAQFSFNPVDQLRFTRQLRQLKPDVVHFTMTQQPLPYFGNIVTTTHDLTMLRFVRRGSTPLPVYWLKMGLYKFMVRWSHDKSKKIIVPTHFVAKDVAAFQPSAADKLVVTYEASEPPLDVASLKPGAISSPFIMYVGTAFPHKNLEKLVAAFDILHAARPDLKLVLVGKKERHYEALEAEIAKHPSKDNIILTGFVPDESLKWLYSHCEAYVFTSLSEGFGLPPLEAMQHGAPVVSSNASCMPEVSGEAAHYFDPTNPADIARGVADVLDNPNLRLNLIEKGYRQVKKYSWRRMAEQTLAVYHDLLK